MNSHYRVTAILLLSLFFIFSFCCPNTVSAQLLRDIRLHVPFVSQSSLVSRDGVEFDDIMLGPAPLNLHAGSMTYQDCACTFASLSMIMQHYGKFKPNQYGLQPYVDEIDRILSEGERVLYVSFSKWMFCSRL